MEISKKKISNINILIIILLILALLSYVAINKFQKNKDQTLTLEPISINLLTSVHPNLSWNFMPASPKVNVNPGEVTTIDYMVENFGDKESTGIATFVYFPKQFEMLTGNDQKQLKGVFLTHAHIGHYSGLIHLGKEVMGANSIPVYAMPKMRKFLNNNGPWNQLINLDILILKN